MGSVYSGLLRYQQLSFETPKRSTGKKESVILSESGLHRQITVARRHDLTINVKLFLREKYDINQQFITLKRTLTRKAFCVDFCVL